jgi:hypothetical protein
VRFTHDLLEGSPVIPVCHCLAGDVQAPQNGINLQRGKRPLSIIPSKSRQCSASDPTTDARQSREPGSRTILPRFSHFSKQDAAIVSIDFGIRIDRSDEHPPNADSATLEIWAPPSNVKSERSLQPSKANLQIVRTAAGIQIDSSNEQPPKGQDPITETFETISNAKVESLEHP